jgi:hypothetical protein
MRYPASEKLKIVRLVEKSRLPVQRTLYRLGIPITMFYRWHDRYQTFSEVGLEDRTNDPGRVWNHIPDTEWPCDQPEGGVGQSLYHAKSITDHAPQRRGPGAISTPRIDTRPDRQPRIRGHGSWGRGLGRVCLTDSRCQTYRYRLSV